ncbi:unnamed protein product [Effrenium voratum]|nr:unnamed protein product [Effrenium voratum]
MRWTSLVLWAVCALSEDVSTDTLVKTREWRRAHTTNPDVSEELCWVGDFSKDACCRGDATHNCWEDDYSFEECCPNADCWDGDAFTYAECCAAKHGERGNEGCWSGEYDYEHCCLANRSSSWVDVLVREIDTDQFYGMDEFYTDAQYGSDFGYYSTGRVLGQSDGKSTQEFAHFTTYPMALSPHFGRVLCRLVFIMWLHMEERAPFRVVEMGAGSGQLAYDIHRCVKRNELSIQPDVWRRFVAAFEYVIMERSPALAKRQRERGLKVVAGDAQRKDSCPSVLQALAASDACGPSSSAPECQVGDTGNQATGASVVLSNELTGSSAFELDAFAPVKLQLSLYAMPTVTSCRAWQELRLVHVIKLQQLRAITEGLQHSEQRIEAMAVDLEGYTQEVFCRVTNSSVGKAAMACAPSSSCLAMVIALSELMNHHDLQLPAAAHNMRLRLRKDTELCRRLQETVAQLEVTFEGSVVLPRQVYRMLRHQLREAHDLEVRFLAATTTRQVPVPLSEERCGDLQWWFEVHEARIHRLIDVYRPLGYPNIQLLLRPGERNFVELVNCLVGSAGFMLAVDYGATFEALGQSMSADVGSDGIFIPPVPQDLIEGLPDCYSYWPQCAGHVDWTTFVDFTNVAAAGARLGWRKLFYGPQSLLEHLGRRNVTVHGRLYDVPGYAVFTHSWLSNHVQNWYGREVLASKDQSAGWQQRWTSFKWLLLQKTSGEEPPPKVIAFPSWHLDSQEADPCWSFDPSALPLADWIASQKEDDDPRVALQKLSDEVLDQLGPKYAEEYEEVQLAVRLVDWLVATEGCQNFKPPQAQRLLSSDGLWLTLRSRLMRAWKGIWGEESLERVARAVLQRLAEPVPFASPAECSASQTYKSLCEEGDGNRARAPLIESLF